MSEFTFFFPDESHTLGSVLVALMMEDPLFVHCGYSVSSNMIADQPQGVTLTVIVMDAMNRETVANRIADICRHAVTHGVYAQLKTLLN